MTADEVKKILRLQPHPVEGGWFVQTYKSDEQLAAGALGKGRYPAARSTGTAIYYLLEPGTFSEMHRLRSDEIFHFYMGDAVEMLQLHEDGRGEKILIGADLSAGERPQVLAQRGVWQGSRLREGGKWALMGCTVSPGFEYEDYEEGWRKKLSAQWPEWAGMIEELTRR